MKFLFTCGGTAGHINPALGVAGRIKELLPDAEILFVGAEGMMETELVPREGFGIKTIKITNLSRSMSVKSLVHNITTVKNVLCGISAAKRIIKEFKPDVAVGTGGYVCYPVLKAAHSLGVPTLVHESNAVPGLTTKLLSGIVDCVMVGFEGAAQNYKPGVNVTFTGTPVRTDFGALDPKQAKARLGIAPERKLVLSVWGSLGSDHMNGIMTDFVKTAVKYDSFDLIHSAGRRGYAGMTAALKESCGDLDGKNADVREYIYNMPEVMAAADIILCRSGASTIGELEMLGKPAILIPSPNVTNNHQEKNARVLEKAGAAKVLLEGGFTADSLYKTVCEMLEDEKRLSAMSIAMRGLDRKDATAGIAELVLSYIK